MQDPVSVAPKKAIVFGITDSLYFALGTMLVGFMAHHPDFDGTFVVFHESLSEERQAVLRRIHPSISFRQFDRQVVSDRLAEFADAKRTEKTIARYSHFYFAKFEIFDLLDEFDKVLWLDVDILPRARIDEIWNYEHFAWRETSVATQRRQQAHYDAYVEQTKPHDFKSPNGGVIAVDRRVRSLGEVSTRRAYHWFLDLSAKFDTHQGDEFTNYLMAATIGAAVTPLPVTYNHPIDMRLADQAKLVHSVGSRKFWNDESYRLAFPDWWMWHRAWVARGGEPSTAKVQPAGFLKSSLDVVRAGRHELFWAALHDEIWEQLPAGLVPDVVLHRPHWQIFVQGCPRALLHLELQVAGKDLAFAVHVEGKAAANESFVAEVAKRLAPLPELAQTEFDFGKAWSVTLPRGALVAMLQKTGQALSGLDYRIFA